MKDYLAARLPNTPHQRNFVREYLQARILGCWQRIGAMIPLAFHGGTALRFLYGIPRYSEDLDFALERPGPAYDFRAYLKAIRSDLAAEGYDIQLKVNDRKVVHSAFIRFRGLLYELGLSPHREEIISIKVEVDTNPPPGAELATSLIRRHVPLQLQHHDPACLLAGKLHAILQRSYTKGRDIYDLVWYLGDPGWPPPNLAFLNTALRQTGWQAPPLTGQSWRGVVRDRLGSLAWERVVADVSPFLEIEGQADLLSRENVLRLL